MMNDIEYAARDAAILIVDDNPGNVMLLEKMLEAAGYANVQSTTDPRQVQALYRKKGFDLILLDIQMPHLNGFQVMEQLAGVIRDDYLPVVVLTSKTDTETRLKALGLGARDFIIKPFDRIEVLTRIRNLLEIRILFNQQRRNAETLEIKVLERTRQLYAAQLDIVRRLGRAGEYRDNETGMHVIRMSKSCERLAKAAGLSEGRCKMLLNTSPLHDVGKIGIPDSILLKPGKLDPDEWEAMKGHVEIGANILADDGSEIINMSRNIVLTHHEKWDGSGYPRGLKGQEIPVEGRIAALCDVFDALTSDRPYKKAWSVDEAVSYMDENAGRHFDPFLVEKFMEIVPDILAIRVRYADNGQDSTIEKLLDVA